MDILAGNFGYFLFGYYLNVIEIKKEVRYIIYTLVMGAVCLTAFLTVKDCRELGTYVEKWFSPASLNILVMSAAIFLFFKNCRLFDRIKRINVWSKLSAYTCSICL